MKYTEATCYIMCRRHAIHNNPTATFVGMLPTCAQCTSKHRLSLSSGPDCFITPPVSFSWLPLMVLQHCQVTPKRLALCHLLLKYFQWVPFVYQNPSLLSDIRGLPGSGPNSLYIFWKPLSLWPENLMNQQGFL